MNKRERERVERERLKNMIKNNPKLMAFLDASIEANNPALAEAIEPVVLDMLEKARNQGIHIGFSGATIGAYKKIENCKTVEEAVDILKAEANRVRKLLGLSDVDSMEMEMMADGN